MPWLKGHSGSHGGKFLSSVNGKTCERSSVGLAGKSSTWNVYRLFVGCEAGLTTWTLLDRSLSTLTKIASAFQQYMQQQRALDELWSIDDIEGVSERHHLALYVESYLNLVSCSSSPPRSAAVGGGSSTQDWR